jgi:bacterioferritin-associated ferredoxin
MTENASDNKADIICGCSGTTVGQILALIEQGTIDMDRISRITGVLSGCGGCEFDVQALVNNHKDLA